MSEPISDERTDHFLEAITLLLEFTDDIPGSELHLPEGGALWLHTERNVRSWLNEMADRIQQARIHENEPAEAIVLNPNFFKGESQ